MWDIPIHYILFKISNKCFVISMFCQYFDNIPGRIKLLLDNIPGRIKLLLDNIPGKIKILLDNIPGRIKLYWIISLTGLNKLFKFKRLNASPEFNKFDNIWHCWELHTIGKSIVAINKKMIDNLKNPVFGDLESNPELYIFITHAVHQLWCLLYLCNPILQTIDISNYEFR